MNVLKIKVLTKNIVDSIIEAKPDRTTWNKALTPAVVNGFYSMDNNQLCSY